MSKGGREGRREGGGRETVCIFHGIQVYVHVLTQLYEQPP